MQVKCFVILIGFLFISACATAPKLETPDTRTPSSEAKNLSIPMGLWMTEYNSEIGRATLNITSDASESGLGVDSAKCDFNEFGNLNQCEDPKNKVYEGYPILEKSEQTDLGVTNLYRVKNSNFRVVLQSGQANAKLLRINKSGKTVGIYQLKKMIPR